MADRAFEAELEREFAQGPAFQDADLFTAKVTSRLDRGWSLRQVLIGGLGLTGGLIGGLQLLHLGLFARLAGLVPSTDALMTSEVSRLPIGRGLAQALASGASMDSEVLWMSAALGILAVGLFVTRAIRDI
jgi:hypothetical protein